MPIQGRTRHRRRFAPAVGIIGVESSRVVGGKRWATVVVIDASCASGGADGGGVCVGPGCAEGVGKAAGQVMRRDQESMNDLTGK